MEEGAAEELLHIQVDDDDEKRQKHREICLNGCGRPWKVCLCKQLPTQPISTSTHILILHHPHELRHKLATVPILTKCLSNSQTLIGRRLRRGSSPLLDSLYNSPQHHRAIFLFPGTTESPSIELNQWISSSLNMKQQEIDNLVLIVFDGTWNHTKEMVKASLPFLSKFATQVCFNCDVGTDGNNTFDSELSLRKQPFSGGMSTIEAVARALCVLEPPPRRGVEIEETLISVLRAMVRFQAVHLKPLKPRPKLSRKGKEANKDKASGILNQ